MTLRKGIRTAWPLLAAVLVLCAWYPAPGDVIDATCRIRAGDRAGTGIAFERSQGRVWILTNAHVVGGASRVTVQFWHRGHAGGELAGTVGGRDAGRDVAVVYVPEGAFGGRVPPIVRLAPPDFVLRPGTPVNTVGAPGGWPTGFRGHSIGYTSGRQYRRLQFRPAPANGRSGSGLVSECGEFIVGLIYARSDERGGYGLAVSVQDVYAAFGTPQQRRTAGEVFTRQELTGPLVPVNRPHPIPMPIESEVQGGIFGGRFRGEGGLCPPQQPQQPQQQGPWPSLPPDSQGPMPPAAGPAAPQSPNIHIDVDLGPIADAIRGPPAEAELRRRMLEAQAKHYEGMAARAEAAKHTEMIEGIPGESITDAAGAAWRRDWAGVGEATAPMLGWLGQIIVTGILSLTGIGGIGALGIRFGVPMALRVFHRRFLSADRNEANEVAEDIAQAVAKKQTAKK